MQAVLDQIVYVRQPEAQSTGGVLPVAGALSRARDRDRTSGDGHLGNRVEPRPVSSFPTVVKTSTGLEVYARLDDGSYPDKIRVPDDEIQAVNLHGDPFHPEWNYVIKPKP